MRNKNTKGVLKIEKKNKYSTISVAASIFSGLIIGALLDNFIIAIALALLAGVIIERIAKFKS